MPKGFQPIKRTKSFSGLPHKQLQCLVDAKREHANVYCPWEGDSKHKFPLMPDSIQGHHPQDKVTLVETLSTGSSLAVVSIYRHESFLTDGLFI